MGVFAEKLTVVAVGMKLPIYSHGTVVHHGTWSTVNLAGLQSLVAKDELATLQSQLGNLEGFATPAET